MLIFLAEPEPNVEETELVLEKDPSMGETDMLNHQLRSDLTHRAK
jgi:hypothetical protein